ncbi:ferrous iron transport protein A [Amycolatopsis sp. NPDC023774]|uniref:putative acetyltransferase n=1 Tax=Amycolatopsis sp. NPDC023774 TaxID=3155015 RepID=UPI0033E642DF
MILLDLPLGTRVVVRYRVEGGFTDALGELRDRDSSSCTVETKRGLVVVPLEAVVAAKPVPPAPARRRPKSSGPPPGDS